MAPWQTLARRASSAIRPTAEEGSMNINPATRTKRPASWGRAKQMESCKMNPIRGLFLVTLLASAPAIAEPFDKTQVEAGAGKIQIAEQRVVCFGNRQCRTVDVKPARAGCRRVSTGGRGRGNAFKVVCGEG